jgi:uncharacterized protein (TIGR00297 family)
MPLFTTEPLSGRAMPALFVTVAFGFGGFLLGGVTVGGAFAGTAAAFLIYLGLGVGGFVTLVSVFVVTLIVTRIGYGRKQQLGLAENRGGRSTGQVLANLSAAALFATIAIWHGWFAVAAIAALAEAAADTAQSEIGEMASCNAWLITGFRKVAPGTDGGVTLPGTLAGAAAVLLVVITARTLAVIGPGEWRIAVLAGFLGTVVDSLIGATIERRGLLNNNGVNFASTAAAGLIALSLIRI